MALRKKTPELVFQLFWKPKNEQQREDEKATLIGIYDTPTTTGSFAMFKSYLLKNSGVGFNDVRVTYVTDDDQEWLIESQEWFEVALSNFRLKARLGEIVRLKLDRVMGKKPSNDVETQSDGESLSLVVGGEEPPTWFSEYMRNFQDKIIEELVTRFEKINQTEESPSANGAMKKVKLELTKKTKRGEPFTDREALKFDRKLDTKLDRLEAKTKKIKEKKQALLHRLDTNETNAREWKPYRYPKVSKNKPPVQSSVIEQNDEAAATGKALNAQLAGPALSQQNCARMVGGEVYLHCWLVSNSGQIPWTHETELRMTWGSCDLIPLSTTVECPRLAPGEVGFVAVHFQIPKIPAVYESNWNFFHQNVRFGQTLSWYVIVEEPLASILTLEPKQEAVEKPLEVVKKVEKPNDSESDWGSVCSNESPSTKKPSGYGIFNEELRISHQKIEDPTDDTNNNNNDNNNLVENVSETSEVISDYDILQVAEAEPAPQERLISGFVYITIDGCKYPVPKHILREDVVAKAEEVPPEDLKTLEPQQMEPEQSAFSQRAKINELIESTKLLESYVSAVEEHQNTLSDASHCSAAGTCFSETHSSRLFIFPENQPGYEVVTPPKEEPQAEEIPQTATIINNDVPQTATNRNNEVPQTATNRNNETSTPIPTATPPINILPENLVTGAVNVASSAINTARSVINMIVPPRNEPGQWINGHWVTYKTDSLRGKNLATLSEMGFLNNDLNATLLARYNDDLGRVISELVQ